MKRLGSRRGDHGFTLIESVMALGLLFTVLLGLLGALTAGVKGVVLGRQRTTATAMATEVIEQARARSYAEIGHATASDPTIATDPALTNVGGVYRYHGEPLVGSTIPGTNPPFTPHQWARTTNNTAYTAWVYVTQVTPTSGDPYKRVTVAVSWTSASKGSGTVRMSTLVYDAQQPPDPLLKGAADADAGSIELTGSLIGPDVNDAHRWFPYTHGEIDSSFIKRAKGFAITPRAQMDMKSGSVSTSGSDCVTSASSARCGGAKAETIADNDAGTAPPESDADGPVTSDNSAINSTTVNMNSGAGTASASSTARDTDGLPYESANAGGPNGFTTALSSGSVAGALIRATTGCAAVDRCSASTVDVEKLNPGSRISAVATTSLPAIDVADLTGAPDDYHGMVRLSASSVTATAWAGNSASVPTISATSMTIQMWDNDIDPTSATVPGYRTFTVTPGTSDETQTTNASMTIGNATVQMTATYTIQPGATSSTTLTTGERNHAEARLADWLRVSVHLVITQGTGATIDMVIGLDYGRTSAIADYQPAT